MNAIKQNTATHSVVKINASFRKLQNELQWILNNLIYLVIKMNIDYG